MFLPGIAWQNKKTGFVNSPAMQPQSHVPGDERKNAVWEHFLREVTLGPDGRAASFDFGKGWRDLWQAPIPLRVGAIDLSSSISAFQSFVSVLGVLN